jgi:hypothetical protein
MVYCARKAACNDVPSPFSNMVRTSCDSGLIPSRPAAVITRPANAGGVSSVPEKFLLDSNRKRKQWLKFQKSLYFDVVDKVKAEADQMRTFKERNSKEGERNLNRDYFPDLSSQD